MNSDSNRSREEANRANARLSTGPRTDAGKAVSSLNHLAHGLSGAFRILKHEDPDDYARLLSGLRDEHAPSGTTEEILVQSMAQAHWLTGRALRLQAGALDERSGLVDDSKLALYLRYQTTHQRAFHRALQDLLKLKNEKRKAEVGFESQKRLQAAEKRRQEVHEAHIKIARADADERFIRFSNFRNDQIADATFKEMCQRDYEERCRQEEEERLRRQEEKSRRQAARKIA